MQRVLTRRYPGVRGSVQYERETGGLVGQLWRSKQRCNHHLWWWWWGGSTTEPPDEWIEFVVGGGMPKAVGRTVIVVELVLGPVTIVVLVMGLLSSSLTMGLLTSWIVAGCTRESGDLAKFLGML